MSRIEFWPAIDGIHVVLIGADRTIRKIAVWPKVIGDAK